MWWQTESPVGKANSKPIAIEGPQKGDAAKLGCLETKQNLAAQIEQLQASIAAKERHFKIRESCYCKQLSHLRNASNRNVQWTEQQAKAKAELDAAIVAHRQLAAASEATICGLNASVAAQVTKIAGLEELGRAAELRCTQTRDSQLETEKQNAQLIERHAMATAEFESKIAAHEHSAVERETTIRGLNASVAAQATKIAELEELGRAAELRSTQTRDSQLETEKQNAQLIERHASATTEFESKIAAHEHSAVERETTIRGLNASVAAQATKIAELEELGRAAELRSTQTRDSQLETEKQNAQLIERHASATTEFESKIAAHEHSAVERETTIRGLNASVAAQATKIAELEELGRAAELRCTQTRDAQLETEKQNAQLTERHAMATAEFESKIAAHEHSAVERETTIRGLNASVAAQATKIAELEELGRVKELRCAQMQDSQLETEKQNAQLIARHAMATAEFESKIAAHEQFASERDSTIRTLEAHLAAQATKIAELEEFGRDAELQRTQTQDALSEIEKQNARLIERHATETAELESKIAAQQHSTSERDATIRGLEASLAAQATTIAELEEFGRDAELRCTQTRDAQLETEKQNAQLIERHVAVTAELESKITAHELSVAQNESTILEFKANLASQAMKIAELEEFACAAELRLVQSRDSQLETEMKNAQLTERNAIVTAELESNVASHEQFVKESDLTIRGLENLLDELRHCLDEAKRDQAIADARAHRCEQTIAQLQSESTQFQFQLQREAAGRRKSEAALKQVLGSAKDNSVLQAVESQFENAQRIDRLTNELKATRKLCRLLQANAFKVKDNAKGTQRPTPMIVSKSAA